MRGDDRLCCGSGPVMDQQCEFLLGHPARVLRVVLRGLLANCEELGVDTGLIGVKIGS